MNLSSSMQNDKLFMMSPMDTAGEERLRQARAHIRKIFGPEGRGRCTKRALETPSEPPTLAKTPRTKLRQRIKQASQVSADQIFFQQFGSHEELLNTDFDLARPAGYPIPKTFRRFAATDVLSASAPIQSAVYLTQTTQQPTAHFASSKLSAFTSSLPAPSTTKVNQLTRHLTCMKTPRKAAIKRGRAGESSAEKELVLRKPRLGDVRAKTVDNTSTRAFSYQAKAALASSPLESRKPFVAPCSKVPALTSTFFSRASPSKFHFSSNATRLFSQRQAPLR